MCRCCRRTRLEVLERGRLGRIERAGRPRSVALREGDSPVFVERKLGQSPRCGMTLIELLLAVSVVSMIVGAGRGGGRHPEGLRV